MRAVEVEKEGRPSVVKRVEPSDIKLGEISKTRLQDMLEAGENLIKLYKKLKSDDDNLLLPLLEGERIFKRWSEYPVGAVQDAKGSQYYYHCHGEPEEHGHFHLFLCHPGIPESCEPLPSDAENYPHGDDTYAHIIAFGMNEFGFPQRLFAVNRWSCVDAWYPATDLIEMMDHFKLDEVNVEIETTPWVLWMARLYRPYIERVLHERDNTIMRWRAINPESDFLEDTDLETLADMELSIEDQVASIRSELESRMAV